MENKIFSAHIIEDKNNLPISPSEYSKFKYGSKSIARKFGKELGTMLGNVLIKLFDKQTQFVVASSPYTFIPTATFALKNYVISALNPILISNGFEVVEETKVYRQIGYTMDYGDKSAEERRALIGDEKFHTDVVFLKDKVVLFLDDIRITGTHEEKVQEMIDRLDISNLAQTYMFVYYAQLAVMSNIDPTIENFLNLYAVKSLLDLDKIIKNDEFIFNTRNVKYILNSPHLECVNFLEYQKRSFIESLYHEAIGNSYHKEQKFEMNFRYLEYLINKQ